MKEATERCRAIKRDGEHCNNSAKFAGFCGVHFPKPKEAATSLTEAATKKLKFAAELVTVGAGVEKLVELLVTFWRHLPFGTGPKMPDAYQYLNNRIPYGYPELPDSYTPCNKGPDSIDWELAKKLFVEARSLPAKIADDKIPPASVTELIDRLGADTMRLVDTIQPALKDQYFSYVGRKIEDDD